MNSLEFNDLITAAKNYYSGNPTGMTDEQYDKLYYQKKSEDPKFNIFDYISTGSDRATVKHYLTFTPQEFKAQFRSTDELFSMTNKIPNFSEYVWTPKWDGCSIRAYYKHGQISDIITRSDESYGKRKYDQLIDKVPKVVPEEVICIDFEALTSKEDYGDDTRSNSNGLINSCYKQDEVDRNILLMPFKVTTKIFMKYLDAMRLVFPDDQICALGCYYDKDKFNYEERFLEWHGKHYPIDGFVLYLDIVTPHKIYKFYYNQNPSTIVRGIEWSYTNKNCWFPKVVVDPIYIDGRRVTRATSNGYARLKGIKAGKGAEVTIILANSTIPQVHEVIEQSEDYDLPEKCPWCGEPLAEVAGKLRCTNKHCTKLVNDLNRTIDNVLVKKNITWENFNSEVYPLDEYVRNIFGVLIIERFNKLSMLVEYIKSNIDNLNPEEMRKYCSQIMTGNQFNVYNCYHEVVIDALMKYKSVK